MVTMHSCLFQRYKNYALATDITILGSAALLNALIFIDFEHISFLFKNQSQSELIIGWFSILTFICSIISILVNWKQQSELHLNASVEISSLLNELREILDDPVKSSNNQLVESFNRKYIQINNILPKVPNKLFNRLKSKHFRKIELSKFIDQHKSKPYWYLKLKFYVQSLKESNG